MFASYGLGFAAKYRFDSMVVKDGDVVVRDLVPVQTTAGKGALFDNASGRVFENATGTDFTKGAAVARQGWVVSTTPTYAGATSAAPTVATLLDSITLTEDTELSAIADRLADAATVNLNGHELHAADYAAFLAKHPVLAGTGNLRVTVPANETLTFNNSNKPVFTGKLIKDGAGTMVLSASMTHLTGVTVAEGIMKHGATSVFSNNGKTIEVPAPRRSSRTTARRSRSWTARRLTSTGTATGTPFTTRSRERVRTASARCAIPEPMAPTDRRRCRVSSSRRTPSSAARRASA